jgi:hypothetical protein
MVKRFKKEWDDRKSGTTERTGRQGDLGFRNIVVAGDMCTKSLGEETPTDSGEKEQKYFNNRTKILSEVYVENESRIEEEKVERSEFRQNMLMSIGVSTWEEEEIT